MSLLATVNGRGILSGRPSAAAANEGYLYYATDSGSGALFRSNGSSWDAYSSGGLADQGSFTYLDGTVAAAPATPAAGSLRLYAKTGKVLAVKDDAGLETVLGAGGGSGLTVKASSTGGSPANLSSSPYVDIDTTLLKATVSGTGPFLVFAYLLCGSVAGGDRLRVTVAVDGTNLFAAGGLIITPVSGSYIPIAISGVTTGMLSSGSHTIAIQGKSNSQTTTFDGGTSFLVLG